MTRVLNWGAQSYRILALVIITCLPAWTGILNRGPARMICHRTANTEMPENTLESLDLAVRLGCSVVEVDLRVTLDGEIVLNHDGYLERLTNGMGEADKSYFDELEHLDAGLWMGRRFSGLRIPRFVEALHLAKRRGIGLVLDIKNRNSGSAVLTELRQEGMLDHVRFGGEWEDIKRAYSLANQDPVANIEPPVSREAVQKLHSEGKVVVANFSANNHETDLLNMHAAVAAGVDWINVDYPRLGGDAIGAPVEAKIAALVAIADNGSIPERAKAILAFAHYQGFPLQRVFQRWLLHEDDRVSRAAAVALLIFRPAAPDSLFLEALAARQATARKNAAWVLGMRQAPVVKSLVPLLEDKNTGVLQETLLALSRCPGKVPASSIEPFLQDQNALVRAAAALALARQATETAVTELSRALQHEEDVVAKEYKPYIGQRAPHLSQAQIDVAVEHYRALMKMAASGAQLRADNAQKFFEREAFRSVRDYSSTVGPVAAYQLWDRVASDPHATLEALRSSDATIADRAEWILIQAGPGVLPAVRQLLTADSDLCDRAIRVVAWQYDSQSLPFLEAIRHSDKADAGLVDWAIRKILTFTMAVH